MPKPCKAPQRGYTFAMETYLEPFDFLQVLNSENVRHWAWILHDKDTHENGELKTAHYHIILTTPTYRSVKVVRDWFYALGVKNADGMPINTLGQIVKNESDMLAYFTHSNAPEKYQYPEEDVQFDDADYWQKKTGAEASASDDFVEDLIARELSPVEMARKYGRDYIRNYNSYEMFSQCSRNYEDFGHFVPHEVMSRILDEQWTDHKVQKELNDALTLEQKARESHIQASLNKLLSTTWR